MATRKRFGQHFLHDPAVIRRIIDAVAPRSGERVVELGPGRGALTFGLLERAQRLDGVEIDRDLARLLEADPRAQGRLHLAAYALGASATGMTFLDSEIPALLGEPLDGLIFTCVGVPANTSRAAGPPGSPTSVRMVGPRA